VSTVIGLDLSLTATGISDGHETWLVRSKGYATDSLTERARRLELLAVGILDVCQADLVVVEAPAFSRQNGHMHDRSGLWWLVVSELIRSPWTQVAEVTPTALKRYATGKGNASKGAMIDATARRFPNVDTGADDNRCDALWLAAMGHDHLGQPLIAMPATHRAALDSVRWPDAKETAA
jgi:crossover junction endodeoxyribonuclease RuvC